MELSRQNAFKRTKCEQVETDIVTDTDERTEEGFQ